MSFLLLLSLIPNITKVVAVGKLTRVEICLLAISVTAGMRFSPRTGAAECTSPLVAAAEEGRLSVICDFRV